MKRIFPPFAYGPKPRAGCWWDETIAAPDWPCLKGDLNTDVAIVGAGFTGVSAALHLAQVGARVVVLEAGSPGWGASGRNGGFCCLGGSKLGHASMARRYGPSAADAYAEAEAQAVNLVADFLAKHQIEADTHSKGETQLAHTPRAMERLRRSAADGGVLHERTDLPHLGLGGRFFGGYTLQTGFGLNPRKYLFGLAKAAQVQGAAFYHNSAVLDIGKQRGGFDLTTPQGKLRAGQVLICTNGYSSEDIPSWMAGRYMPVQSSIMVTRPLTEQELQDQGWTSDQMCYDTRHLLHYFRLMPDRRFLFGMRGGLRASPRAEAGTMRKLRSDFATMFPKWAQVDATHSWSGFVCMSRDLVPYVGPVPGQPGMFAGFAYHGNGVAMGTYCGRALARLALGQQTDLPAPLAQVPKRFPLGRWRRALMPIAYAALTLADL
ncbi:FAD-binding oxidoreductase [Ruegeria sp. HKCCD7255]|uniref:NAD(P)/FAD-dependent oxidoreductase n=1 Tax=Ruegeria sp. HKCCD7255 TaxID=2683004 RepID=UPI00148936B9|nr:FAD-binding oxidoreductase [Ruegeria sp. HKCCD7255]